MKVALSVEYFVAFVHILHKVMVFDAVLSNNSAVLLFNVMVKDI